MGSVILTTASCSWLNSIEDPTEGWSADKLYVEGRDNLNERELGNGPRLLPQNWKPATRSASMPSKLRLRLLTLISVKEKCLQAIIACDRFLRQYPDHPLSPYAMYISRALPHWTKMTDG